MGGSSAFGPRTGDVFTKITVGVAIAWILLSMFMVVLTNRETRVRLGNRASDRHHDRFGLWPQVEDKAKGPSASDIAAHRREAGCGRAQSPN